MCGRGSCRFGQSARTLSGAARLFVRTRVCVQGEQLMTDSNELRRLARIHVALAREAMRVTAFESALRHLSAASRLAGCNVVERPDAAADVPAAALDGAAV